MERNPGNNAAADDQAPVPLADRVDRLEKKQATLIRLLADRGVLPCVTDKPVPASPGLTVTSGGAALAYATRALGLALGV